MLTNKVTIFCIFFFFIFNLFGYYIYLLNSNQIEQLHINTVEYHSGFPILPFPNLHFIYQRNNLKRSKQVYENFRFLVSQYFLKFIFNIYSQEDLQDSDFIKNESFKFTKIEKNLTLQETLLNKFHTYDSETLEFLYILSDIPKNICRDEENMFVYLRGDYDICKKSFPHLLTVYHWASIYKEKWSVIRLGGDFSGILFQCKDVVKLNQIIETGLLSNGKDFSYQLANNWGQFINRTDFTYRFKLFVNSVQKDECLSWNLFPSKYEQYSLNCDGKMMSPCNNEIIDMLKFRTFPEIDIPLDYYDREILLKRINFEILGNLNMFKPTCLETCEDLDMECIDHSPIWLNNCELLRKKFKIDCRCYNMVNDESAELPLWDLIHHECHLLTNMTLFDCKAQRFAGNRMCLCHKLSGEDKLHFIKKSQKYIQEFNRKMSEYYGKQADSHPKLSKGYGTKKKL